MKTKCVISVILAAVMLASCSTGPDKTSETASETVTDLTVPSIVPFEYETAEPVIESINDSTDRITFYRDGNEIIGNITRPEGSGPYKTIIILGGLYASLGSYSGKAKKYNENGYAVIEVRPTNNKAPTPYKEPAYLGDFVFEQMADLCAVIDSLKYFQDIDTSNIYLFGHSMGGLGTVYAGIYKQDEIKGMILVEPSFQYPSTMKYENDTRLNPDLYGLLSDLSVPVVIFKGTGEREDIPDFDHFYDKAIESLPDGRLVVIDGANHFMGGEPGKQMIAKSVEIIKSWH